MRKNPSASSTAPWMRASTSSTRPTSVYNGDEAVLVTKVRGAMGEGPNDSGTSRHHILGEVENSLRRLDVDHIDLYLIHRPDQQTPIQETLEALDLLVRQGKVRYVGCSNFDAWQICEALWTSDRRNLDSLCCVQSLYNIVNRDPELELFPFCQQYGIGVMAYSPLARGVLSGKYADGEKYPDGSRAARGDRRIQETEMRDESFEVAAQAPPAGRSARPHADPVRPGVGAGQSHRHHGRARTAHHGAVRGQPRGALLRHRSWRP